LHGGRSFAIDNDQRGTLRNFGLKNAYSLRTHNDRFLRRAVVPPRLQIPAA
jgi:hypothetical protein